ncbi:MAG TPA: PAS domain S-box protein [Burkholderiaceae bacterium]|nr:PAS domain S-box protein [Burkholderiaceae bacterium]
MSTNRVPFHRSIRGKLVLLLLVTIAPVLAYVAYSLQQRLAHDRAQALERALAGARTVAALIDEHFSSTDVLLRSVAALIGDDLAAVDANDAALRALHATLPDYVNSLSVLTLDGRMLNSTTSPRAQRERLNFADRDYFRAALAGHDLAVGAPIVSRTSGQWIVVAARPLVGRDGTTRGVVSVSTRLARFQNLLQPLGLPPGSLMTVLDERGTVIARSLEPQQWVGKDLSQSAGFRRVRAEREFSVAAPAADGVSSFAGYTTARRVPWVAHVGIGMATALQQERTELMWLAAVAGVALLIAGALAGWIAAGIARPLVQLTADAAKLAAGNLAHRSRVRGAGEVTLLAQGFNRMASELETRNAEAAAAHARVVDILERIGDAFVALDRDWNYVYVNERAAQMFGRSREALIGRHIWTEFPEGVGQPFHRAYEQALAEQRQIRLEDYYAPWDRWFENRIYPTANGLAIFFTEITERKRYELALRAAEERLRLAVAAARIGLWDWDIRAAQIYISPEWKRQLGFEDAEIANRFDAWQQLLHPAEKSLVLTRLYGYLENPAPIFKTEFRLRHKDGSYRWILSRGELLRDAAGQPVRLLGCHIDITERKVAEEALRASAEELRDLSRRLMETEESERRAINRELHDRVGPNLSALSLALSVIQAQLGDDAQRAVGSRLQDAQQVLEETVRHVRDVMAELRPPALDEYGLAAALRTFAVPFAARFGVAVEVIDDGPEERLPLATETALFRIAQEALNNAAKHARAAAIEARLSASREFVELSVNDEGAGFTLPAAAPARATWGLTTMRERAAGINAELRIESAPGRGARVTVRVPRAPPAVPAATTEPRTELA